MKFCLGPMSKNIVDAVLDYSEKYKTEFTFIPSRRQVDKQGGYVNRWTTQAFCEYVKQRGLDTVKIQRDHGGPGQGDIMDDGIDSFLEDVRFMDSVHIDPWKKYPIYEDALEKTIQLIELCYKHNPSIEFEVGTEEGIRPISVETLDQFCKDLKDRLAPEMWNQIRFLVIQCGTQLLEKENIGSFDEAKLSDMLEVAKKFGLQAKEHNGDWISQETVKAKERLGLGYINIAPELGELETKVILQRIQGNPEDLDLFYRICLASGRWKKWVSSDFDPSQNKEKLILICGHYVFSDLAFLDMKKKYEGIDGEVKSTLTRWLHQLLGVYEVRTSCIFCSNKDLVSVLRNEKLTSLNYSLLKHKENGYFIPYMIQYCRQCNSYQNKYIANRDLLYAVNHMDSFGQVKKRMHEFFASFIESANTMTNTVEIGAGHDYLSRILLANNPKRSIHIIDPYFVGKEEGLHVIRKFVEAVDLNEVPANAVIMSSVFENFYNPHLILEKLRNNPNIQCIFLNYPQLEYALKNDIHINLTTEHTYYIENDFLIQLFEQYGFYVMKKDSFEHHTNCYLFVRGASKSLKQLENKSSILDMNKYILRLDQKIKTMNTFMEENPELEYYIWPCSMHLMPFFTNGFRTEKLKGILDNSPNKIGKYFYGYNLPCFSFVDVAASTNPKTCIFLGGAPNYRKELMLKNQHCKFYEI